MNNGIAASFQNNSAHGEDTFLIREISSTVCLDAVLDGVTHCEGGYASGFTRQCLQDAAIETLSHLVDILEQVNDILFREGRGRNLLTAVSAALKVGGELHVIVSGDSPAYLIRQGEIRELTNIVKPSLFPSHVSVALALHEKFTYEYNNLVLQPGDRLVLATDGLVNNIFPQEIADIVQRSPSPHRAASDLEELMAGKRVQHIGREDLYGTFREDDQTAIIRYFD